MIVFDFGETLEEKMPTVLPQDRLVEKGFFHMFQKFEDSNSNYSYIRYTIICATKRLCKVLVRTYCYNLNGECVKVIETPPPRHLQEILNPVALIKNPTNTFLHKYLPEPDPTDSYIGIHVQCINRHWFIKTNNNWKYVEENNKELLKHPEYHMAKALF